MVPLAFAAILAIIVSVAFPGPADAAPPGSQPVLQQPAPVITKPVQPVPGQISSRPVVRIKEKQAAALTVTSASGAPGEKATLEATLKSGQTPLAGKMVTFQIESKGKSKVPGGSIQVGSGATNAAGKVAVSISVPELARGSYELTAWFSGDESTLEANAQASFLAKKASTKIDLTVRWQEGTPLVSMSGHAILNAALVRKSDEKSLDRRVTVVMEGYTYVRDAQGFVKGDPILTHQSSREFMSNSDLIVEPLDGIKWKVAVRYDGDDSSLPSTTTLSYVRPKESGP